MSRSYTAMEYLGLPLAIVLSGLVLILVVGIWLIPKAARKFKNPAWAFSLLLLPICAYIGLASLVFPCFAQLGDLLIPNEYVLRTSAGRIEMVVQEDAFYHIHDGKIQKGEEISVEGVSYYVLSEGILEEGLTISFTYAQFETNVILGWQEVTPEEAAQIRAESVAAQNQKPAEKTETTISPQLEALGVWLLRIGFVGLVAIASLQTMFYEKLVARRFHQVSSMQGEIRFNRLAFLERIAPAVCMSMLNIGFAIQIGQWFVTILLLVPMGMLALSAADATTWLKLDGATFTVARLGRQKTYRMEDVRAVLWRNHRGLIGRSMVLVLHDGKSYWFDMDNFCGVEYAYKYISRYLDADGEPMK